MFWISMHFRVVYAGDQLPEEQLLHIRNVVPREPDNLPNMQLPAHVLFNGVGLKIDSVYIVPNNSSIQLD